ncbi:hypothetical protein ACFFTM_17075 [Pseudoduganella plicata]|uniref:DUF697 domain-containing protein n=1 Tax=Pseudoduganella plicata TaxID=321984 RepID=A0A4P7BB99_9BURK|nr:hypothetical protein [Pseudoduganella plicata]QBQ35097.1 hypothetical protein E1742_02100 [Pseudoduganella plicata]GGZ10212.1 hypothetical protein GCM10007388_49650 [Pseudoduganella plicata]
MHAKQCSCGQCRASGETFEILPFGQGEGSGFAGEFANEFEGGFGQQESPFSQAEEMELAMELLAVASEEELEQFLGNVFKGVWKGIKKVGSVVGKVAKPLGGVLKGIAKQALPFVGGALGSMIPIPGVGTMIGRAAGTALSKALEMEFEGMALDQQEFEMARRFVRIAGSAAQQAAQDGQVEPAVLQALRQHAPGIRI